MAEVSMISWFIIFASQKQSETCAGNSLPTVMTFSMALTIKMAAIKRAKFSSVKRVM